MEVISNKEEGKTLIEKFICGDDGCDSNLEIAWGGTYGIESLVVICPHHPQHTGFRPRTSALQEVRRTAGTGIDSIPMDAGSARRQINTLSIKYPDILQDAPSAALFLYECKRLALDPFIQPAEAVPISFFSKKVQKRVIGMVISSDGWLSMAARSAPSIWMGPPTMTPVNDATTKKTISGDSNPDTLVVEAKGKVRDKETRQPLEAGPVYGWFKASEASIATLGNSPFNMACKRAIKRWVRENYPTCRQVMMEQTASWMEKSEGIKVTEGVIETEFHLIEKPEAEAEETSGAGAAESVETTAPATALKVSETMAETPKNRSTTPPAEPPVCKIDQAWLADALKKIHWSDKTTKSMLTATPYSLKDTDGSVYQCVCHLSANQLDQFYAKIKDMVDAAGGL